MWLSCASRRGRSSHKIKQGFLLVVHALRGDDLDPLHDLFGGASALGSCLLKAAVPLMNRTSSAISGCWRRKCVSSSGPKMGESSGEVPLTGKSENLAML